MSVPPCELAVLAALLVLVALPAVARAAVSTARGDRDRQAAARGPDAAAHASRRALHRAPGRAQLARARAPGVPEHAARELARSTRSGSGARAFAGRGDPAPRGHRGDPHRTARPQGRRLAQALQGAHPVRDLRLDVPHLDGARQRRAAATARSRRSRSTTGRAKVDARLDGPAGELGDGARLQGLVRPQAQRHAALARVLRRLPARAGRLAAHPHAAHARPRHAARVLGLALVLRARASCSGPCRCSTRRWST